MVVLCLFDEWRVQLHAGSGDSTLGAGSSRVAFIPADRYLKHHSVGSQDEGVWGLPYEPWIPPMGQNTRSTRTGEMRGNRIVETVNQVYPGWRRP
jgi:hypothetical protein